MSILETNQSLCEALGVDLESAHIASVTLKIRPEQTPVVVIEKWIEEGIHLKVKHLVSEQYELTPKKK